MDLQNIILQLLTINLNSMSLYSTPLTTPFNSDLIFSQQLLKELQNDKQLVDRIRRQRLRAQQLKQGLQRKQAQINKMNIQNKQLIKLRPYYDKFHTIKQMLDQTLLKLQMKQKQNIKLSDELQRLMIDIELYQKKLNESDKNRLCLMKQRSELERINSQIQQTFLQYKNQCKNKQNQLIYKLERLYKQVKDQKKLIDQLDETKRQLYKLRSKCDEIEINRKQLDEQKNNLIEIINLKDKQIAQYKKLQNEEVSKETQISNYQLALENEELRKTLFQIQKELQKSRKFNHNLSIQYDSSVNKNLDFQRQLHEYRRENHQLKKQLSLFIEKEQYQKYYKKEALDQSLESEEIDQLSSKNI